MPLAIVELVAALVEGRGEAEDRRNRRSQLVRGERDEVCLDLVGAFERKSRLALVLEEAHAVEREAGERADRLEHPQLLAPEERRVRRRPYRERPGRDLHLEDLRVGGLGLGGTFREPVGTHRLALVVAEAEGPGTDDLGHRREHSVGDLLLAVAERDEILDCVLDACLGRAPPDQPHDRRRREREQEAHRARDGEHVADQRRDGVRLARGRRGEERDRQERRRES